MQKFWALAVFSGLVVTAASSGAMFLAGVPVAGHAATRRRCREGHDRVGEGSNRRVDPT